MISVPLEVWVLTVRLFRLSVEMVSLHHSRRLAVVQCFGLVGLGFLSFCFFGRLSSVVEVPGGSWLLLLSSLPRPRKKSNNLAPKCLVPCTPLTSSLSASLQSCLWCLSTTETISILNLASQGSQNHMLGIPSRLMHVIWHDLLQQSQKIVNPS